MSSRRNVGTYLAMTEACGRALLWGILKYSQCNGQWRLHEETTASFDRRDIAPTELDGIIAMVDSPEDLAYLDSLGTPFVPVFHREVHRNNCGVVYNHRAIGMKAAAYFAELGFQNIGFFSKENAPWSKRRGDGLFQAGTEKGKTVHIYNEPAESMDGQYDSIEAWLTGIPKPAAVMAYDDRTAKALVDVCLLSNLRVPDEVAVAGVDNDALICSFTKPPLTSLELSYNDAGFRAAELLEKLMSGEDAPLEPIGIEPGPIKVRQSTDILAISDPEVVAAVEFIRSHSHQPIQVSDVMEHVNASQPTLVNRFKRTLGRTIAEEIAAARVQRIGSMLCETNMAIGQIAKAMGYASDKHLARVFRRFTGVTPTQYRQQHARSKRP